MTATAAKYITAAELGEMYFAPLQFVCDPILTPGATMLAGRPKCNKSWLMLEIAFAVATGESACGEWKTEQGDVLYLALEDNHRRLKRRLGKSFAQKDIGLIG